MGIFSWIHCSQNKNWDEGFKFKKNNAAALNTFSFVRKFQSLTYMFIFIHFRYDTHEVALNCGVMLRECIRHESLARIILKDDRFYKFFEYVEMSTFDIASDAFTTFKVPMFDQCSYM